MRVKLVDRHRETPDVVTFVFDLGGQSYPYTAGQFAFFELDELTVDDPRGKRRHFTLSSSPSEHGIVQFTTKMRGFGFKETLYTAALGLEIALEDARGRFTLPESTDQPIVFLGGGVGVTPFRSMLRYAADELLPHNITMLYAANTPEQLIFRREFELLPQEHDNLKLVLVVTEENGSEPSRGDPSTMHEFRAGEAGGLGALLRMTVGRIDADKVQKYVNDIPNTLFYTCGPPPMVQAMQELLQSMNVPDKNVRVERFSGYV